MSVTSRKVVQFGEKWRNERGLQRGVNILVFMCIYLFMNNLTIALCRETITLPVAILPSFTLGSCKMYRKPKLITQDAVSSLKINEEKTPP